MFFVTILELWTVSFRLNTGISAITATLQANCHPRPSNKYHRPMHTKLQTLWLRLLVLQDIVPTTGRGPILAVDRRRRTFGQQSLKLSHSVRNHQLGIALDQNIQLRILARLGRLAGRVVTSLGRNRSRRLFENLCNIGSVGDGPASFLCKVIRIMILRYQRGGTYGESR